MFCRWMRTVPSDTSIWRAIWALVCPAAARRSTSHCRGHGGFDTAQTDQLVPTDAQVEASIQQGSWDCAASNGEALSRVLAGSSIGGEARASSALKGRRH